MDGEQILSTQAEIEEHILKFYTLLYSKDEIVEAVEDARADCFQYLKRIVTEEHNSKLLRPLMLDEVASAVKQLPAGKAPGIDTIPAEFYQAMWEDIEADIFNFVSEAISSAYSGRH